MTKATVMILDPVGDEVVLVTEIMAVIMDVKVVVVEVVVEVVETAHLPHLLSQRLSLIIAIPSSSLRGSWKTRFLNRTLLTLGGHL